MIAPPDDVESLKRALTELHDRFANGGLPATQIPEETRYRLRGAPAPRSWRSSRARCNDRFHPHARDARPRRRRALLATVFTVTFSKLQEVAGDVSLSDVLTALFLVAVVGTRLGTGDRRLAWGAAVAALFFLGFLAVYLIGFFNLDTEEALAQWAKGISFVLHFLFLVAGISYLARRAERFYWWTLTAFMAGFAANALYGIVQLGFAEVADVNLDQSLLSPITGGASQINIYGAIEGRASTGRMRSPATRTT